MPNSSISTFKDPDSYQAAIRGVHVEIYPTAKGQFWAELTDIDLGRLGVQRGQERLARISLSKARPARITIGFLANANEYPVRHCGFDVSPGDIVVINSDLMHRRTETSCRWASISLTPDHLAAAGAAIIGRELTLPLGTHIIRPSPPLMSRLSSLHEEAGKLARTDPERLARVEISWALEQALFHALVMCLTDATPLEPRLSDRHHSAVIARLEQFFEANYDRPVYLAEICATIGVSERMLRVCCQNHLGMGPMRYLWLRRMHLARRALMLAKRAATTVTEIATDHGFWELGRFSVEYRRLFGELPSVSLHRQVESQRMPNARPFALSAREFANPASGSVETSGFC